MVWNKPLEHGLRSVAHFSPKWFLYRKSRHHSFIKERKDLLMIQIYVDNIIFGATNEILWEDFATWVKKEFEIIMIDKLTFLLGLQIKQTSERIFINQSQITQRHPQKVWYGLSKVVWYCYESWQDEYHIYFWLEKVQR